jgi:hypothetical protein
MNNSDNNIEIQNSTSIFTLTLMSGEVIIIDNIQSEDINEDRDNSIVFMIDCAVYNHKLYEAFRNKSLIKSIQKDTTNTFYKTDELITRTTNYNCVCKIQEFITHASNSLCTYYSIRIESI